VGGWNTWCVLLRHRCYLLKISKPDAFSIVSQLDIGRGV
jgi:hypothetical protein